MTNQQNKEKSVIAWVLKAQEDEMSANALLHDKLGSPNTVCFLSQQMTEKYLKAYLVFSKNSFPQIHQLDRLVRLCSEIDSDFQKIKREAEYLTTFYVTTRYPGDYPNFDWDIAAKTFAKAEKIKKFVLAKIEA